MSGEFDLAIIGSGAGAFAAAITARQRDLRVVMIERATVGGTCVNVGCIPSKALLAAGQAHRHAARARFPGIRTTAEPVDLPAVIAAKDELVESLRQEKYLDLAADYGFEVLAGEARFVTGPALELDGRRIAAAHYLIATGAVPHVPDIPGLRETGYLTSTTAMAVDRLPASLLVVGGGYVALEQAQLFAHLGSRVTVLVRSSLARGEEPEVADAVRATFLEDGIDVFEGAQPSAMRRDGDHVVVAAGAREWRAEQVLVATGRRPNTGDLGLAGVGVETGAAGEVVVGADLRTSNPRIWAAGDVTGHPQFVYVAARQGAIVVDNAFGDAARTLDYTALPRITFTSPTLASAGLTVAQARDAGHEVESRVLDLAAGPRAIVSRSTRGLVKLVAERASGRILGVHLVGEGAGDVILAGIYAIENRMTVDQMAASWNPYLTLGEAVHLAAQSFTRDPSRLSCCAA